MSIIYTHSEIILEKDVLAYEKRSFTHLQTTFFLPCALSPTSLGQCLCPSRTLRASWTFPPEHSSWCGIRCWHNYLSSVSASPDCKLHGAVVESVLLCVASPGPGAMPGMKQAPRYCWRSKGCYPCHHLVLRKMLPQTERETCFSKTFKDPVQFSDKMKDFSIHNFNYF